MADIKALDAIKDVSLNAQSYELDQGGEKTFFPSSNNPHNKMKPLRDQSQNEL
jgi:hypothetical protein